MKIVLNVAVKIIVNKGIKKLRTRITLESKYLISTITTSVSTQNGCRISDCDIRDVYFV